jgi:hypothetical protein
MGKNRKEFPTTTLNMVAEPFATIAVMNIAGYRPPLP